MSLTHCVTCGAPLSGPFCATCGERRLQPDDFSIRRFLEHALEAAIDLDGRLPRSFITLFARPGELTAEYMRGRRRVWLAPIQLFLIANLVFFVLLSLFGGFNTFTTQLHYHVTQPVYGPVAERLIEGIGENGSAERAEFQRRFDEATPRYANSMVIVMIPLFAALLALLLLPARSWFVHHLVFAIHFFAFLLLVLIGYSHVLRLIALLWPPLILLDSSEFLVTLPLLLLLTGWLATAVQRAYGLPTKYAIPVGVAATVLILPVIMIYRAILFFAVYLNLR